MSRRTRLLNKLKHVYSHNAKLVLDVSNDDIGLIIEALETKIELNKRNMTPDIIKEYMIFEDECIQKNFTFKSLLESREKQIAKKPRYTTIFEGEKAEKLKAKNLPNFEIYKCPICNNSVAERTVVISLYPSGFIKDNYCRQCGTKIDWSEDNV